MSRISHLSSVKSRRPWGAWRRLVLVGGTTLIAAGASVAFSATAFANSADPLNNPAPIGAIVVNSAGTATVSVTGSWVWPFSKLGATATHPCDNRIGVGWGVVWKDSADAGTTISFNGTTLGVGSTGVNPANTDNKVTYNASDPCGTFTKTDSPSPGDGDVSGTWTGTHTYANLAAVPTDVCIVTYDLGYGTTPAPFRLKLTWADNSLVHAYVNGATWDPRAGGPNCTATSTFKTTGVVKATPTLATHATTANVGSAVGDTATLSATNNGHGTGTITFNAYGPTDTQCSSVLFTKQLSVSGDGNYGPVSFVPNSGAGSYRWIASYSGDSSDNPVAGHCGDADEISLVTAPSTSPTVSPPTPTTPSPAPAAKPIPGVTTVHTGEPWAGAGRIVVGSIVLGLTIAGLGLRRRRLLL